ncbi:MAG: flagellar basal-body MS-ring/collar protein FliF [Acetobacteraceae bacterium]
MAAMAGVAVLCLGLLGFLALRGGETQMAPLYSDLDLREAGQIVDQLDRAHILHQLDAGGTRVLVPVDQVARARLLLAKEGLPSGGSIGYEIFDRSDGLTANSFQQGISHSRALEGELSRTIRSIQGVRAARVHLVLPRREPFSRDRQEAQASVVLTMTGVARLDREGVQSILNLISAAVPGLRPQNIAMVDSRGNLLARAGQPTGAAAAAQTGEEMKRATELRLSRAIEEMLERSLGAGRVRAEAAVELDFDQIHETQERFDPDGQVVRSQQSSTGNSRNTEAATNVSVQNNLPNADASAQAPTGSQEQKQEETTNYEISKTVRTLVHEQPQLHRISLAVMVDGVVTRGADGTPAWAERPPEELARIATLVRSAIGFNEARGDRVDVVTMRFTAPEDLPDAAAAPVWARLDKADIVRLTETGLLALAVLAGLIFVLRPMAVRLAMAPKPVIAGPEAAAQTGDAAQIPADEEMIQMANVDGAMRVSSIRRVATLIERRPEESLALLRSWFTPEHAE